MTEKIRIGLFLILILAVSVLLAGCSSNSSQASTTVATTTTTMAGPKYVAGDIVATSSTQAAPLWLILSYDQTQDQYTRAMIYKNSDGSWGYRVNSDTSPFPRADMEKVYPVKIAHVTVTSVPIVTPTAPTTVATTLSGSPPSITSISPTSGAQNSVVTLTITGNNFLNGATVEVIEAGSTPVSGTGLSVTSSQITGSFNLNGLAMGKAIVKVTNPDGQYGVTPLSNEFTIGQTPPTISTVSPTNGVLGSTVNLTITGQNFATAVNVYLGNGVLTIPCSSTTTVSSTSVTTVCVLSNANAGSWNVTLINIDGGLSSSWSTFSIANATNSSS